MMHSFDYIVEIFNNGFENVVEILNNEDDDEEHYISDIKRRKIWWKYKVSLGVENSYFTGE